MVLPLKKAVDSLFNRCGTTGIYQGREVLFLLTEPDEVVGVGFVNAHTDTHQMRLRVSDAPDLGTPFKQMRPVIAYIRNRSKIRII